MEAKRDDGRWNSTGHFLRASPGGVDLPGHVYDICLIKADGTGFAQLTSATGDDNSPRWTRDGRIVFTSERDGNREIYIMNADGSGQTNLTNSTSNESVSNPLS